MSDKLSVKKRITIISNKLRLGKDGKNTFSGYEYFKPDDILKKLNPLLEELELITIFSLKNQGDYYTAILTVEDTESDSKVEYTFDIAKATVKGANEAQNSGATLTYAKRYSLMNAFNIADNDMDFDSDKMDKPKQSSNNSKSGQAPSKNNKTQTISKDQARRIFAISSDEVLVRRILEKYKYASTKDITVHDYEFICHELELESKKAQ